MEPGEQTSIPPDLITTMGKLTEVPNDILREHYGERIRFLAEADEDSNEMMWSTKVDDVLEPIAILTRTPPDTRVGILGKKIDNNSSFTGQVEELFDSLLLEGKAIQARYACDHIGLYDGENVVLFTFYSDPAKGTHVEAGWQDEVRSKLMVWLGGAIRKAKVKMLKPLTGYTLEDSSVEALGLDASPPRLMNDNHIDHELLLGCKVRFGGCQFILYTMEDGRIVTAENSPLPTVDSHDIATATGVRSSSQMPLIDLLVLMGEEHVGNRLKYSYDLVPNALVWYIRRPADRSKEFVGIFQFAPTGTIVPSDWGLRNRDLTFTNGEGIVRTAKPLLENLLLLGQQHECFSVVLFDYYNAVMLTRSKAEKVPASIALITGGRIRGASMQWLIRALEIAEDGYTTVS
jgi:hypothetical protein